MHVTLSDHGVKKRKHADFAAGQAAAVYAESILPGVRALNAASTKA